MSLIPQKYSGLNPCQLTFLKVKYDIDQCSWINELLFSPLMEFSKSFGYALRGVLFIARANETNQNVRLNEIAERLSLPRYFLGKLLRQLAKNGVLNSVKGPKGGFSINEMTLQTTLFRLIQLTGETENLDTCVLHLGKCNSNHPCPLHFETEPLRKQWQALLDRTTVEDLLNLNK